MKTDESVPPRFAAQVEQAEIHAWLDLYAAAPAAYVRELQPEIRQVGNVVLTLCPKIPFVHFNCVLSLGLGEPAREEQVDALLDLYRAADVRSFAIFHNPLCQPAELPEWFEARGLKLHGGWDRIYRGDGAPATLAEVPPTGLGQVEGVTQETAEEWAEYLDSSYRLPTKPWLLALVGRPGWRHSLLRREGRIVAVRSLYLHADGMAWMGIEAPVPGLMGPSYDLDAQLCQALVREGLELGAQGFVADIEAPSAAMDTPAYRYFGGLGFRRLYLRSHYGI
jgi:hypothetical protein